jgi:calcineurin-like phosphoesterase family protein
MIWFTSDTHFDHANILKYTNRPWASVDEMNEGLIKNWNSVVRRGDVVYHLGDFAFRNHRIFAERLNGQIFLVEGSHDRMSSWDRKAFVCVGPQYIVKGEPDIILCHYAMRVWPRSHYGTWHLFGHSHGSLCNWGKSFDVGVDVMNYFPVSLETIKTRMESLSIYQDSRYREIQNGK